MGVRLYPNTKSPIVLAAFANVPVKAMETVLKPDFKPDYDNPSYFGSDEDEAYGFFLSGFGRISSVVGQAYMDGSFAAPSLDDAVTAGHVGPEHVLALEFAADIINKNVMGRQIWTEASYNPGLRAFIANICEGFHWG